ncbi:ribosome maturation factor RimM [Oscillatoria sp. CS-180]|uniref:ribosome maturation factor RimM n=1 Tax=Oscillatoria sp. CS-180 TaxID=3021720 RepID=UPI00232FBE3E|nr:ribosome maturation factor RimM [Oscillatoria sp. CS-180]MDB9525588.1 ribosome maturation factor RimM [Oscillatoria sp. CS-180]
MADSLQEEWLEIGRIVAPQGLDGSLRVYPNSDFPERFLEPGDRWLLKPGQSTPESVQLLSGRYLSGKGLYVIKLKGINYRDQAETLRDAKLVVSAGDRLELEPDEFHVSDLVGLEVRLQDTGQAIGTVVDIYAAGNDLLAVQLKSDGVTTTPSQPTNSKPASQTQGQNNPVLIPFVYDIVPVVDLAAGFIEITPPKGLLPTD